MTLEDFFTLTEMKDGLTAPARVEELVAVMHKEKDYVVKNASDATRHWSTVATTLAATENKDCLDLFIQLDGLWFIDRWLRDAQSFNTDTSDSFAEESITALLRALEKLCIDNEKSMSSGVWITVKNLLSHKSSRVQDMARVLFDSWKVENRWLGSSANDDKNCLGSTKELGPTNSDGPRVESAEGTNDSDGVDIETGTRDPLDSVQESSICAAEETVDIKISRSPISEKDNVEDESDVLKRVPEVESLPEKLVENGAVSLGVDAEIPESTEPSLKYDVIEAKDEGDVCARSDEGMASLKPSSENDGFGVLNHCRSHSTVFEDSSGNECISGKPEEMHEIEAKERESDEDEDEDVELDLENASDFSKPKTGPDDYDVIDKGTSDMELEYGIIDALEVARQVAIEVEREVVDYEETVSTSSSEKIPGERISPPCSPDSAQTPAKKIDLPEHSVKDTDLESSRVAVVEAQEAEASETVKGICDFDLNEEVCFEEMDRPSMNPISTPIPVVSASRTGLPVAPLHFEGALGWKGSAATSAFRRIPESDRSVSVSNGSKQRQGFMDFDLNMDGSGDDKTTEVVSSEKFSLDLNLISDDGDAQPPDSRIYRHQNGHRSPSPASSSSNMQPSFRNFDLNDNPTQLDDSFDHLHYIAKPNGPVISIMGAKVEVNRKDFFLPTPSPMLNGRVQMEPGVDPNMVRMGGILGVGVGVGPTASYPHSSHVYGYTGPTMSFTSAMYGPGGLIPQIPYMVDSRVAPVGHQMMGPASAVPPSYSQPPPFIMSMAGPALNGAGPSRPNFDLNSGFMIDGGNRDLVGGLRQPFVPGQSRLIEEHLRLNAQPSSSSSVGKRKEPDGGWDSNQFNYKYLQPPWR